MPTIDLKEMKRFVARNNLIMHMATIQANGRPCVNAIWYEFDGTDLYLILRARSSHAKNITKNPKVALYFDLVEPPFTRVLVEGDAKILGKGPLSSMPEAVEAGRRMATRYLGPKGPDYLVPTMPYPRFFVKIKPIKWHGWETFDWPDFMKK